MSDWQAGDLALCIEDGPIFAAVGIFSGRIYRVLAVARGSGSRGPNTLGLVLDGIALKPPQRGANAEHFRKIRPDAHEKCEDEFTKLVRRKSAPTPAERERRILSIVSKQGSGLAQ